MKKNIKTIRLTKIEGRNKYRILLLGFMSLIGILLIASLFVDLSKYNNNSTHMVIFDENKNSNNQLYIKFKSINTITNMAQANIEYQIIKDNRKDIPNTLEFMIFSGDMRVFSNNAMLPEYNSKSDRVQLILDKPDIIRVGDSSFLASFKSGDFEIHTNEIVSSIYYPFDKKKVKLNILVNDEKRVRHDPQVFTSLDDPYYIRNYPIPNYTFGRKIIEIDNSVSFIISRPLYIKVLFVSVISFSIIVLSWCWIKIISGNKIDHEFFLLIITMLFAMPSLKEMLTADSVITSPLIDIVVITIWIISFFVIIIKLWSEYLERQN